MSTVWSHQVPEVIKASIPANKVLASVIIVAVLLRIGAALYLGDVVREFPGTHDQISYDALARNLLAGKGYSFDTGWYPFMPPNTPTAFWSFAYPAYLAGVYFIFGYHPLAARLVQSLLVGILMPFLLYRLGKRVFTAAVGLLAAAWSAIYIYFIYYAAALMTESLFIVGVLLILDLFLTLRARPNVKTAAFLGIAVGCTVLLRLTILPVLSLLFGWLIWEHRRRVPWKSLAITTGVILLFVLPWTVRNYLVFDDFLLLNSNAGYAFWSANHPRQGSSWQADIETVVVPLPQEWTSLNEAELDKVLMTDALNFILADPQRYVLLSLSKVREQFKFWPDSRSPLISNLARTLSFGVALPFMLSGLVLSGRLWRHLMPLYLFIISYNALSILSWPSARYRLTTDAIMLLFAAYTLTKGWNYLKTQERMTTRE